jgi:hypothetical protein
MTVPLMYPVSWAREQSGKQSTIRTAKSSRRKEALGMCVRSEVERDAFTMLPPEKFGKSEQWQTGGKAGVRKTETSVFTHHKPPQLARGL